MGATRRFRSLTRSVLVRLGAVKKVNEVVIVAASRTGTNYLCGTLGEFPRSLALHEIFGASSYGLEKRDYLLPYFSRVLGRWVEGEQDKELNAFLRQHPQWTVAELAWLASAHRESMLSYKVFPNQVRRAVIASILAKRRPAVIFVVRARLPSYISNLKAQVSRRYIRYDSSDVVVEADLDEFLKWSARRDQWYSGLQAAAEAAKLRQLTLGYERHIDVPREQLIDTLRDALRALGVAVAPPPVTANPEIYSTKQDRTSGLFSRLANGAEFEQQLRDAGRLDYATSAPLTESIWSGR